MEIYVSVDVETDGPIPGPHSMLSLGAAAFSIDRGRLSTFTVNFAPLEGANPDPATQAWWESQPKEIYDACRTNPQPPRKAMQEFDSWVRALPGKPVFVGYPAGFDFLFVYWYLIRFLGPGNSPFSFSALDIKTYVMAVLKKGYRDSTKKGMPKRWFQGLPPHTHNALDDAIEQGQLFMNILKENLAYRR